jgi:type I restriction enzyme S subunit
MKWNKQEWKNIELGETASFINGYAFKPSQWESSGSEIIRIQNLTKSSKESNYFNGSIPEKYKVSKGDLLISWSATLGVYEWKKDDAWLNQHIFKVVFDKKEVDKNFFNFMIQASLTKLERQVHGATMKHITKKKFDKVPVVLPPLHTQKEIADLLDTADALRKKTQAQLDALDELAQSVFLEMFGDPVTNEKGWEVRKFEHFANFDTKMISDFRGYEHYPHIGIANIEKETGRLHSFKTIAEDGVVSGKYLFSKDHIIYSKIRPNLNKVALPNFDGLCSADSYPILVKAQNTNKLFFASLLRSDDFIDFILGHSVRTNIPKANKKQMMMYEGICPPLALQNQFATIIENIEGQKASLKASLQESEDLFGCLLQEVFD